MDYIYQNPYALKFQEYRVRVVEHVSKLDLRFGESTYLEQIYNIMRERLSDIVANGNMTRTDHAHEAEFVLDIYAIPPAVLNDVIEEEVQRRVRLAQSMWVMGE